MKPFLATRVEHDGEYSEEFFAIDATHAKEVCEKVGWFLDGELMITIPCSEMTIEEADAFIANKNNEMIA